MTEPRRLRIDADVNVCAGVRQCVLSDPTTFGHDDRNIVKVLQVETDDRPELAEAIGMCPTGALRALDVETGEIIHP